MGLSINEFTYTGSDDFNLSFALGFSSQSDITCVLPGDPPVDISFDWIGPSAVRLASGHGLAIGDVFRFYRTVSKTTFPVNLSSPGALNRETVEEIALHNAYVMHEVLDGRVDDVTAVDQAVLDALNGTVENAITGTTLLVSQRYPVYVHGEVTRPLTGVVPVDMTTNISEVTAIVNTNPSVDVELLFTNDAGLKFWINVTSAGVVTTTTTDVSGEFTLAKGGLVMTEAQGNYVSGLDINIGINGVDLDYLAFTSDQAVDYVAILDAAIAGALA